MGIILNTITMLIWVGYFIYSIIGGNILILRIGLIGATLSLISIFVLKIYEKLKQ